MKNRRRIWMGIGASIGMIVLILDAKTALSGARDGIKLCTYTVIPSLFPFFLFSVLLNHVLLSGDLRFLHPLGKLTGIPTGAEPLLLIGLIGGYPVGAQCISDAYRNKCISRTDAHRMLGFCSNAGPAFIFGMGGCIFQRTEILWVLWAIHILSALIVGAVLPAKSKCKCVPVISKTITITHALEKSLRTLASVCGWIIIFRVIVAFLSRWCLWLTGDTEQTLVTGLLELSNGCFALLNIPSESARFVLCATFLGFGGICVLMQTCSVTDGLGLGMYFPGKVMQATLSLLISGLLQSIVFARVDRWNGLPVYAIIAIAICVIVAFFARSKKRVEILC